MVDSFLRGQAVGAGALSNAWGPFARVHTYSFYRVRTIRRLPGSKNDDVLSPAMVLRSLGDALLVDSEQKLGGASHATTGAVDFRSVQSPPPKAGLSTKQTFARQPARDNDLESLGAHRHTNDAQATPPAYLLPTSSTGTSGQP
jgi:hypothetical protein